MLILALNEKQFASTEPVQLEHPGSCSFDWPTLNSHGDIPKLSKMEDEHWTNTFAVISAG